MDRLTGARARELDISDPDQRNEAVRATILASTSLLSSPDHDRFVELAVFAEDETVPVTLITALWQATGGLDQMSATALCARLADLALVTLAPSGDGGTLSMHDVILDFVRGELGEMRLAALHRTLLDAVAAGLPHASGLGHTAWWELSARLAPGNSRAWEVSWLPGRLMDRNSATTAMVLADMVASDRVHAGHRLWPHIKGWAAELALTPPQALSKMANPPNWANVDRSSALADPEAGE